MRNILALATVIISTTVIFSVLISTAKPEPQNEHITREIPSYTTTEPIPMPENGWYGVFDVPKIFTSEELEEIIPNAPHYSLTRPVVPHPERQMTESERDFWIRDYKFLGGINAQEFELYKIVNEVRAEHGLPPFILCPKLSMAARLFSYLQVREHSTGHTDPYYTDMITRMEFFGAYGTIYMENANSQMWYESPNSDEIEYVYLPPQGLVDIWMDSPAHRAHILTTQTTHVGFGVDSGNNRVVPTMKSIMPRDSLF